MHPHLTAFAVAFGSGVVYTAGLGAVLSVVPRAGAGGRAASDALTRAPLLDVVVSLATWVPWAAACAAGGWAALLGTLPGQAVGLGLWCVGHETAYREAARGPRIVKALNRTVGRWRNHVAIWVTTVALPGFLMIRAIEVFCWPMLVWLLGFPRYRHAEWVNCTRQKFDGLIGHDLVWCLYCDWMTGVYSLGAEMLRSVESFWCPIRFYDGKKCENCKLDFPDIENAWVPPTGTMADVEAKLDELYAGGNRSWAGHPTRLTVNGREPA